LRDRLAHDTGTRAGAQRLLVLVGRGTDDDPVLLVEEDTPDADAA
jgi:hypothetical protein